MERLPILGAPEEPAKSGRKSMKSTEIRTMPAGSRSSLVVAHSCLEAVLLARKCLKMENGLNYNFKLQRIIVFIKKQFKICRY